MGRMQIREQMIENAREICELQNYIIRQVDARQGEPTEDMTSDLVHASLEDGTRLTREEQIAWVRALLVGGADSTTAALANLLMIIATQPELAQQLQETADDDRLLTRFVDEVLRLEPPAHGLYRTAKRDVRIGGVLIPAEPRSARCSPRPMTTIRSSPARVSSIPTAPISAATSPSEPESTAASRLRSRGWR